MKFGTFFMQSLTNTSVVEVLAPGLLWALGFMQGDGRAGEAGKWGQGMGTDCKYDVATATG